MTIDAIVQLGAVLLGGVLAIIGGIVTANIRAGQEHRRDERNLAMAFRGEITALLELVEERRYLKRLNEVIAQIEETQTPFLMPFRVRFKYDRVYDSNIERIGILKTPLPEQIPHFYTRLTSILEDLVSLGDGTYADCEVDLLLRIYRDTQKILQLTQDQGAEILALIRQKYPDEG